MREQPRRSLTRTPAGSRRHLRAAAIAAIAAGLLPAQALSAQAAQQGTTATRQSFTSSTTGSPSSLRALHNVRSTCVYRGPIRGQYTHVCVRLQREVGTVNYRAYGAINGPGSSTRVFVRALHLVRCSADGSPCSVAAQAPSKGNWDDVSQWTNWHRVSNCVQMYAVMSYDIRWSDGTLTRDASFPTARAQGNC